MKNILFVSDVWPPEKDGVVTSLLNLKKGLEERGYTVHVIEPGQFMNFKLPFYKDIRLSVFVKWKVKKLMLEANPDYIHIATPGTLGFSARSVCIEKNWKFTTFYHTRYPEYLKIRFGGLKKAAYNYLRWFNEAADKMMVSCPSLKEELKKKEFKNMVICPLGVDTKLFQKSQAAKLPEGIIPPVFTFLGRIGPEKNIKSFLKCNLPGSKLIIGDGAIRKRLEKEFPKNTLFVGKKSGHEIVDLLSISDVFVFPSKTDTFGLSMLEAMATEVPIAAYNVPGPKDIITNGVDGYFGKNLEKNALKCLELDGKNSREKAKKYSWEKSVTIFLEHLTPI